MLDLSEGDGVGGAEKPFILFDSFDDVDDDEDFLLKPFGVDENKEPKRVFVLKKFRKILFEFVSEIELGEPFEELRN